MIPSIGIAEMVVLGVVAVLLFGKRLPEVARNVGKSYGQLRKGLTELQTTIKREVDDASAGADYSHVGDPVINDYDEPTAPKLPAPPADD